MTVTTKCTVKVETVSLRAALAAVYPHHKRTRKDADLPLHRVRLIFANGKLFVAASQGISTAMASMSYKEDSRGNLWEPDDGPILVDLQPRHVPLLRAWMAVKAAGDDVDQLTAIDLDTETGEIEFENIGGLNSAGERVCYLFDEPAELFPDIIAISGKALAEAAGESERARTLVQDGKIIDLFKAASVQYGGAPLRIRPTGQGEHAHGFVVECGSSFVGTMPSDPGGDEGTRRHAKWTQDMIQVLQPRKLASA